MWCHLRMLNPQNKEVKIKKIAAKLNYSYIKFPLDINDYELIKNRFNMNINVFGYENKVYPLYISKISHTQTLNLFINNSRW